MENALINEVVSEFSRLHPKVSIVVCNNATIPCYEDPEKGGKKVYPQEFDIVASGATEREAQQQFKKLVKEKLTHEVTILEKWIASYSFMYSALKVWRLSVRSPSKGLINQEQNSITVRGLFSLCVTPF